MMDQGILSGGQGAPPVEAPASASPEADLPPMDPKTQEVYDIFSINATELVHTKKVSESILDRIAKSGEPISTISDITVDIVNRLYDTAKKEGMDLTPDVILHGGNVVLGEVLSVTEAAGMQTFTEEQKTEAFQRASAKFLDDAVKAGRMTSEEVQQLGKQAQQSPQGQEIAQKITSQAPAPVAPAQAPAAMPQGPLPTQQGILQGGQNG